MTCESSVSAGMRLSRDEVALLFGVEPAIVAELELTGAITFDANGKVGLATFGAAILKVAIHLATSAREAMCSATQIVETVAKCGVVVADTMDAIPTSAAGAAAMRELITYHVETMIKFHTDLVNAVKGAQAN